MSELTLEIVLLSIFGTDLDRLAQRARRQPLRDRHQGTRRATCKFAYKFRQLAKLVAQLIAQRRRAEKSEHFDFLQMLMDARDKETGAPMSERELIDEVMTLIVAGHETTASGLNWTWYLLSQNPQAEARLHAEIDAARRDSAEPGARARWSSCRYTQKSSTRRCGSIRRAGCCRAAPSRPTCSAASPCRAGTDVLLPPYLLHRHPRYWKDPERFRPERFDAGARKRTPALRLHALRRRPAALHR